MVLLFSCLCNIVLCLLIIFLLILFWVVFKKDASLVKRLKNIKSVSADVLELEHYPLSALTYIVCEADTNLHGNRKKKWRRDEKFS